MFSRLRNLFLILSLVSFVQAQANEKKAEAEAKEEGGKAEGKAEGKSEGKDEYGEVQGNVSTLQAKIKSNEEAIHKLIEEKHEAKEASKVAEIIKNLVSEHKSMQKNIEEYEKARSYLQYRFPEKGLKGKRTYERFELKSLEEMEHEMTMETRLKKTLNKVRKQYRSPEPAEKEVKPQGNHKNKSDESPEISEPVILSK